MVLIWVNARIQPRVKIPKNNNMRGVLMVSNDAIQLGPKEFLPGYIFRRVLYSTGCINRETVMGCGLVRTVISQILGE